MPILTTVLISAAVAFSTCLTHCGASKMRNSNSDANAHRISAPAPRKVAPAIASEPAPTPSSTHAPATEPAAPPAIAPAATTAALSEQYAAQLGVWTDLTKPQRHSARKLLASLLKANNGHALDFLRHEHEHDVVGVVARAILLHGSQEADRIVVREWYPEYARLAKFGKSADELSGYLVSDWAPATASEPAPTPSSTQVPAIEPAAPPAMETSTEAAPATATTISAVVQDAVHDGAQDDEALDALPSTGAASVVCENEDAVFLNVAASVECEDDDRCAPQSLMRAYMRKVMEWRGLSADRRRAAIQTIFLLDKANRGRPFVALRDGMDVVGDVIRSILRHEIVEGGDQDLGEWFRQCKALCASTRRHLTMSRHRTCLLEEEARLNQTASATRPTRTEEEEEAAAEEEDAEEEEAQAEVGDEDDALGLSDSPAAHSARLEDPPPPPPRPSSGLRCLPRDALSVDTVEYPCMYASR